MPIPLPVTFLGGSSGHWQVLSRTAICGPALPAVSHLAIVEGEWALQTPANAVWTLRGVTSNERYVHASEHALLVARQPSLGRHQATRAALIPIKKSAAWWDLSQDQR